MRELMRLRDRLPALGYDVSSLPQVAACGRCGRDGAEMHHDGETGTWLVWCECGRDSGYHPTLLAAILTWNAEQEEQPALGVEAANMEVIGNGQ
jgi:hypothetical protein